MKRILIKLIRNFYIKCFIKSIIAFICEYLPNHIINNIPNAKLRLLYYKYILKHKIDNSAYICMNVYIYASMYKNFMYIGKNTIINRLCVLDAREKLYIGNNVNISSEVAIYTGGHKIDSPSFEYYGKPVEIEDYVWIGTRAMIMPGVRIGKGAMIMPGSIVTKNVGDFEIIAGIPGKRIGYRNKNLNYNLTWRGIFL